MSARVAPTVLRMRGARRRRRAVGIAALAAALASAGAASAGETVKYDALPTGHVTTMPGGKRPAVISAHEQVAGFFVAVPKFSPETPARARHVGVVGDAKLAEQIRENEGVDMEREDGACFSSASGSGRDELGDDDAREWPTGQMWQVNLWPRSKDNDGGGVNAVHRERLVQENGTATLESVDAWIDPQTHGARLIARASLPLVQVGSAIGGITVFAGRDERSDGTRYVQYVVVHAPTASATRLGSMMAMRQDGNNAHGSGCGHLRMPLAVEMHDGDTAVVLAPVELPAPRSANGEGAEAPATNAKTSDAAGETVATRSHAAAPSKAIRRKLGKKRPPPSARPAPEGEATAEPIEREARTRDMQIHLGVSQSSRDTEPRLTISFGWASREQVQRVFDEPGSPSRVPR